MANTNAKIKGSLIKLEKDKDNSKCRKWKIVLYLGRDPLTKKHQQKAKRFSGTYVSDINKKVSLMMDHAKKNGYIKQNPCKLRLERAFRTRNRSYHLLTFLQFKR